MIRLLAKYCAALFVLSASTLTDVEAQVLRLGERIPDINLQATLGTAPDMLTCDYVCLIFVHSESQPSIEAIDIYKGLSRSYADQLAAILITPEERGAEHEELDRYVDGSTSVGFDNNYRTFNAFDIKYVPFGVIYKNRTRKILWFGSIGQLNTKSLNEIIR